MARQIKTIDYDHDNDIFSISDGEKVKASLDIGDFILDVSHDNLICGLEIMNASENLGISRDVLKNIQNIRMSVSYQVNHAHVLLMIVFKKEEKEVNITIPLSINLGHKELKREVLIYN